MKRIKMGGTSFPNCLKSLIINIFAVSENWFGNFTELMSWGGGEFILQLELLKPDWFVNKARNKFRSDLSFRKNLHS